MGTALGCGLAAFAPQALAQDAGLEALLVKAGMAHAAAPAGRQAADAADLQAFKDPAIVGGDPVSVDSDGNVDILSDSPVVASGDGTPGIFGRSTGGNVVINSQDVTTHGVDSDGIVAESDAEAGYILLVSENVVTHGDGSSGIVAHQNGILYDARTLVFSNSVTTSGADAIGIHATANGGVVDIDSKAVATSGINAHGILGESGSDVNIVSDLVTTSGDGAIGIHADAGTFATVDSLSVETQGDGAHGIVAEGGLAAYVLSENIVTSGEAAHGIIVSAGSKTAYAGSDFVETSGDGSVGILATSDGYVFVNSGTIVTSGEAVAGDGGDGGDGGGDGGDGGGDGGDPFPGDGGDPFPPSGPGPDSIIPDAPAGAAVGIVAISQADGVRVESNSVTTYGAGAIAIQADAHKNAIVISDEIHTEGDSATGISARSRSGDVAILSGVISTQGEFATGISANSELADALVLSDQITTAGFGATGIDVVADKNITIESNAIATTGDSAMGISVFTLTGEVDILSGSIDTTGDYADAISARGLGGGSDIRILADTITTAGEDADGIFADTYGDILIEANSIATTGEIAAGIFANAGGDITVRANTVSTSNGRSNGISLLADGGSVLVEVGEVSAEGDSSSGIEAVAAGGDVDIVANSVSVSGDRYEPDDDGGGLPGGDGGGGPASNEPSWQNVVGIAALTEYGDISVTAGTVSAAGENANGISVFANAGQSQVTAGTVMVDGTNGVIGIRARGDYGADVIVDTLSATSTLADGLASQDVPFGEGISVGSITGEASVRANSVTAHGVKMTGVELITLNGSIRAEVGDIVVTGEGGGGALRTLSSASVSLDSRGDDSIGNTELLVNSILTSGDYIVGVRAVSTRGANTIKIGSVETDGVQSTGIFSATQRGADIEAGTIVTTGDVSDGIRAVNRRGLTGGEGPLVRPADEIPNAGADGGGGAGLPGIDSLGAQNADDPLPGQIPDEDIVITADSVSTSGDSSRGISAHANGNVTITSGSVTTTGEATSFYSTYVVDSGVTIPSFGLRQGTASFGIDAVSDYGSIAIESGYVSTLGAGAHGIRALTTDGSIDVTAGDVSVSGAGANGLHLVSQTGDVTATITGTVLAENGAGLHVTSGGDVTVNVADGGALHSADNGFAIVVMPGQVPVIPDIPDDDNPGDGPAASWMGADALPGGTGDDDFELVTSGATVNVEAGGLLQGRVSLTDADDTLNIAGDFRASGVSLFGAGDDALVNTGTVHIIDGAAGFDGLERFENQGLLNLADGSADDSIDFTGIAFTGGTDSVLAFDVLRQSDGTVAADSIAFGDVDGTTTIRIAGDEDLTLDTAVGLITFNGTVADGAFRIDAETADAGFMQWRLVQGASGLALATSPDAEVFEVAQAGGIATGFWHRSADAFRIQAARSRSRDAREGRENGVRGWIDVFNGGRDGEAVELSTQHDGQTFTQSLVRDEDASGVTGGLSLVRGAANFGLIAGFTQTEARFEGTGNRFSMDGVTAGLTAGWQDGPYFANALAKIDSGTLAMEMLSADERVETDVTVLGASGEIGARFGQGGVWFEPVASLSWVSASIDAVSFDTGSFALDDGESLLAEIGGRLGNSLMLGSWTVRPAAGLFLVSELSGENGAAYTSGSTTLDLTDEPVGSYGRIELGVTFELGERFDLSVGGESYTGDQSGGTMRVGAAVTF